MKISKKDRYLGCLVGLAVGDALGAFASMKIFQLTT